MHYGFAIMLVAALLSYNLYLKCDTIISLAFLFTWGLMYFMVSDILKLVNQDKLVWKYLKSQEEQKNKEKKDA